MALQRHRSLIKIRPVQYLRTERFLSTFPFAALGQAPGGRLIDYFACIRAENVEKDLQQQ